jgi:hypothetical protein
MRCHALPCGCHVTAQVPELLDADRCTLFFVDKDRHQLVVRRGASMGRKKSFVSWVVGQYINTELPFEKGSDELRFSMSSGLAGHVATHSTHQTLPPALPLPCPCPAPHHH